MRQAYYFANKHNAVAPPNPTCVECGKRKKSRIGMFCSIQCATKFSVKVANKMFTVCDRCKQHYQPIHCGDIATVHHASDGCPNCGKGRHRFGQQPQE